MRDVGIVRRRALSVEIEAYPPEAILGERRPACELAPVIAEESCEQWAPDGGLFGASSTCPIGNEWSILS